MDLWYRAIVPIDISPKCLCIVPRTCDIGIFLHRISGFNDQNIEILEF